MAERGTNPSPNGVVLRD